jgi:hypothetical protein
MIVTKKSQESEYSQSDFVSGGIATVISRAGRLIRCTIAQGLPDAQYGKTTEALAVLAWASSCSDCGQEQAGA